jgi:hypothetical protein
MIDEDIDDCDCERLREDFTALRTAFQEHYRHAYDDYRIGIEEAIKTYQKRFFLGTEIYGKNGWVIGHEFCGSVGIGIAGNL